MWASAITKMKIFTRRASIYLALLGVGIAMFSSLLSLVPARAAAAVTQQFCQQNGLSYDPTTQSCTTTTTKAPPPAPFWALSLPDQAKVWTELAALPNCSINITTTGGGRAPVTTNNQQSTKINTWFKGTVDVGTHVDPVDGRLDCNDENGWLTQLANDAGYSNNVSGLFTAGGGTMAGILQALTKGIFGIAGQPTTIPSQLKYWILMQAFTDAQGDTSCAAEALPTSTPDAAASAKQSHPYSVDMWVAKNGQVVSQPWVYKNQGDTITVGYNVRDASHSTYSCGALASVLGSSPEGLQLAQSFANNDTTDDPTAQAGTSIDDSNAGCDLNGDPFTWFICPVINIMETLIQNVDNLITASLTFDTKNVFDTNPGYRAAWNTFRVLATGLLVIAGLVMVVSQAFGLEILDAYTLKKVLPRLLIAVIGITLSWSLMHFAIDFFNVLGDDIRNLIYSPFGSNIQGNIGAGAAFVLTSGGVIGLFAYGPGIILSVLATAALAVLVGFIIILVRYLAIIVLVIFAPIAIAAYVLPNTSKVWTLWKDNFLGLLLVFPIISAFIAIGRVFSAVSLGGGGPSAFGSGAIMQIVGLVSYFLPYFLLPIAFRLATGVIGTVAGFVNDRNKGAFDRLKKGRQHMMANHGGRRVEAGRRRAIQRREDWNQALKAKAAEKGKSKVGNFLRRRGYGAAAGMVGGYNINALAAAKRAEVKKEINSQIDDGADDEPRGLTVNKAYANGLARWAQEEGISQAESARRQSIADQWVRTGEDGKTREYRTAGGAWVNEGSVDQAWSRWGHDTFAQQTALSYESRKATTDEEIGHLREALPVITRGWKQNARQAKNTKTGMAFQNQGTKLSWKYTSEKSGDFGDTFDSSGNLVWDQKAVKNAQGYTTEWYEKFNSYTGSQQSAEEISRLKKAYDSGDAKTQANVKAIAETYMHDLLAGGSSQVGVAGGVPQTVPTTQGVAGRPDRQASGQGSPHFNEAMVRLARDVGVYTDKTVTPDQK